MDSLRTPTLSSRSGGGWLWAVATSYCLSSLFKELSISNTQSSQVTLHAFTEYTPYLTLARTRFGFCGIMNRHIKPDEVN